MRILVVEDDSAVAGFLNKGLAESGHNVDVASEGKQGLFLATTEQYDAIVLDRMLPGVDGITILNTLRASEIKTPVLILSAKNKVDDKVKGLRSGADDYLTKPFAFEELLARLDILVARSMQTDVKDTKLRAFDLELDLLTREVNRGTQNIELQSKEFRLLEYMLRNKGQVITRTMLLEHVWDYHFDPQTNVIDVHISRLRQKIDKGFEHSIIETIRGAGYRIPTES
ncbi:response regulator transcription factor [Planctobacterium marinum]|uniref:DNA-binding response regulator n=1 Tax=Planctobacterium marinum TaxID=1631968 RepID=A0AA48KSD9_9ALTE|nr:DNA-binding response regulator [Planctobacterium marinum]